MNAREFHPADIFSVTSGVLVSPHGIQGVVEFLSHLTGIHLHNDQVEQALGLVAPLLAGAYPDIAAESVSGLKPASKLALRARLEQRYGAAIPVEPIAEWPMVELRDDVLEDRFEDVRKDRDDPRATARDNALAKARRVGIETGANRGRRPRNAREATFDLFATNRN